MGHASFSAINSPCGAKQATAYRQFRCCSISRATTADLSFHLSTPLFHQCSLTRRTSLLSIWMSDSQASESLIKVTTGWRDGIAIIELNRPQKRNALSQPMIGQLISALFTLDNNDSVRAVVITGSPGGPFSGKSYGMKICRLNS